MGEAEVGDVAGQLLGQGAVVEAAPPRPEVHLVDRKRPLERVDGRARREPRVITPDVVRRRHQTGGAGWLLGLRREGVGLELHLAVGGDELVLVPGARPHARDEELPHTRRPEHAHEVHAPVPRVEVADDAHAASVWRPDRERGAGHALVHPRVRAEVSPQRAMQALSEQVQIDVAQRGPEAVRVVDHEGVLAVLDLEPVRERAPAVRGELRLEQPVLLRSPRDDARAAVEHDGHGRRVGTKGADDRPVTVVVQPEEAVRVAEPGDVHYSTDRRRRAASGIRAQSGRCACS